LPSATEEQLKDTGLPETHLTTYRLVHVHDNPLSPKDAADRLGLKPETIARHLRRVKQSLTDPDFTAKLSTSDNSSNKPDVYDDDPERFAEAVVKLSSPAATAAQVARDMGMSPRIALKIGKKLEGELQPLGRVLEDVALIDLLKRFGTMTRDAIDAITPEKLEKACARDLAVIAGIGAQNWQLMRGQPTSRVEIGDRRQMDEVLKLLFKEAERRGVEIDVTPEGTVTAGKSKYTSGKQRKLVRAIASGDPEKTLTPA